LDGESYANSFQLELNYNAFSHFDLRLAYKYYDVKTQYDSGKLGKPLTPQHRLFANGSYETQVQENGGHWKFDATYNWLSKQRISSTDTTTIAYQVSEYSSTVRTVYAQITKVFSPKFEIYFGGENINNVRQENAILASNDPFGS